MKRILISAILVGSLVFVVNAHAIPLSALTIQNDNNPGWRWDTDPTTEMSPIGVATSLAGSIVQFGTGSKSIDGLVNIASGGSVYLFTEAFSGSVDALFQGTPNQPYTLTIKSGVDTYTLQFSFGPTYGVFNPPASTSPFLLAFLGFTGIGDLFAVNDKVGPYVDTTNLGLTPNGAPDAVYQLTYTAVPEPITLFLLGAGLIGLVSVSRRFRK